MGCRVALALVLVGATACATLQPVREPARFIAERSPAVVYVTHKNRALLTIAAPRVSGDTLLGTWQGSTRPIALPFSQVARMEARQRDRKRTTLLIVGLGTLTAVGVYAVVEANSGKPADCDYNRWPPICTS